MRGCDQIVLCPARFYVYCIDDGGCVSFGYDLINQNVCKNSNINPHWSNTFMMVVEAANIDDVVQQTKTSLQETKMETKKQIWVWKLIFGGKTCSESNKSHHLFAKNTVSSMIIKTMMIKWPWVEKLINGFTFREMFVFGKSRLLLPLLLLLPHNNQGMDGCQRRLPQGELQWGKWASQQVSQVKCRKRVKIQQMTGRQQTTCETAGSTLLDGVSTQAGRRAVCRWRVSSLMRPNL